MVACLGRMEYFAPALLGYPEPSLDTPDLYVMNGPLAFLERVISGVYVVGLSTPMIFLFFLFVMRILLRNTWLAGAVAALVLTPLMSGRMLAASEPWVFLPFALAGTIVLFSVLIRFGFLALAVLGYVFVVMLSSFPLTFEASSWYAGFSYAALGIVAALALFGFKTSLGGRRLFDFSDA